MASIIMKRGTTSEINNTPISDGQILFETDTKNIYIDEGSNRTKYRALTVDIDNTLSTTSVNPVQNKVVTTKVNNLEDRVTARFNTIKPQADSGYVIIGNTLIQWGRKTFDSRISNSVVQTNISFPIPFADLNYVVNFTLNYHTDFTDYYDATPNYSSPNRTNGIYTRAISKSGGFTTANFPANPISCYWIAIGKYTA